MSWLMQILQLLLNGQSLKDKSQAFTEQWLNSIRQLVLLLVVTIIGMVLFCVAVSFAVKEGLSLADNGGFTWSAFFTGSVVLAITSLITIFYGLSKARWLSAVGMQEKKSVPPAPSPIEEALALVIKDFVKEREFQREHSKQP